MPVTVLVFIAVAAGYRERAYLQEGGMGLLISQCRTEFAVELRYDG